MSGIAAVAVRHKDRSPLWRPALRNGEPGVDAIAEGGSERRLTDAQIGGRFTPRACDRRPWEQKQILQGQQYQKRGNIEVSGKDDKPGNPAATRPPPERYAAQQKNGPDLAESCGVRRLG
jgi:hypothetical protein